MPFIKNDYVYPIAWHGGMKDLEKLDQQKIKLTIRFPYTTASNGTLTLTPVTVNLATDLGVDTANEVYAVTWGDDTPELDTVSQGVSPAKHVHTYAGGTGFSSRDKVFNIILYGYDIKKFKSINKNVGDVNSGIGYSLSAQEVSRYVRNKGALDR